MPSILPPIRTPGKTDSSTFVPIRFQYWHDTGTNQNPNPNPNPKNLAKTMKSEAEFEYRSETY
jgi:hypothetical protein